MSKYWKSISEFKGRKEGHAPSKEMSDSDALNIVSSRREFLKIMGVGAGSAALLNSCQKPIQKAIPHLVQPEEIIPGTADYFATSYYSDNKYCSVLAKVRDGRPIKIEGNIKSPLTEGGTTAQVQASVLGLYDQVRYKHPMRNGVKTDFNSIDRLTRKVLEKRNNEKKVALLTQTVISPSTEQLIKLLMDRYPQIDWIQYDAISSSAMLVANEQDFDEPNIPLYHFERAEVVVGIDADFLGTWIAPALFINQYAQQRNPMGGRMLRHFHFESGMTLTGATADYRFSMEAGEERSILLSLYNKLAETLGEKPIAYDGVVSNNLIDQVVEELLENKGKSLVVCGSQLVEDQRICNRINVLLGNLGSTVDFNNAIQLKKGVDSELYRFKDKLQDKEYTGVIFCDVNPVYNTPFGDALKPLIPELDFSLAFAESPNETSVLCKCVCPLPHYLESWNDAMPFKGYYGITQPVIRPLFDSRSFQASILTWLDETEQSWHQYIKQYWQQNIFPTQNEPSDFASFWEQVVMHGYYQKKRDYNDNPTYTQRAISVSQTAVAKPQKYSVKFYESVALGSGRLANNPMLMELPDPISKVSWDNYAAVSVSLAKKLGVEENDAIQVGELVLPVFIQPGQAANTVAIAMGFGRHVCGKVGKDVGINVYPMLSVHDEHRQFFQTDVALERKSKRFRMAISQTHGDMEGRPIVRETTLKQYKKDPYAGNEFHKKAEAHKVTLYDEPKNPGHHWGLAVDLSKCVGCNNCVISCQIENNVPVIGKEQVRNRRIMHWMRIDRYYSGNPDDPQVMFQPVMCQHCDNAPCENVCPVSATVHSNEGLNQMAYNRCVGTRYCLNNCPYRVRRFNWFMYVKNEKFDFVANNDLGRMVLNPDVTVRSRGVIEKCSFCVQRIQEKKLLAKKEGRPLHDGEIQPACMQSCPAKAIVFGDMNDPSSLISKSLNDERSYHLLEELHTLPGVSYLTKVRNKEE